MMLLRLMVFVTSLISLSYAAESSAIESCFPESFSEVISLEAGQSLFSVVTPPFAGDCEATVISSADPLFHPLNYKYDSAVCTTRRRVAFMSIPNFVPSGKATILWQCQNTVLCRISLLFSEGYTNASGFTTSSGEQQGEQSCISDLHFSPTEAGPPWMLWTDKKRSIGSKAAKRFPLNNITAPMSVLRATASSALWATSSDFKSLVGTGSSRAFLPNITSQTPSGSTWTTALNQPGASIESITSAAQAAATATTSHRTAFSVFPTISQAKPPGKPSDPILSNSVSNHAAPLSFAVTLAALTTVIQAIIV